MRRGRWVAAEGGILGAFASWRPSASPSSRLDLVTDERIREFQRRARAQRDEVSELRGWAEAARSGVLPHEAVAIVERVGRGALDRERLALAAYAGEKGALPLLEEETAEYAAFVGDVGAVNVAFRDPDVSSRDVTSWLRGLERWGGEPHVIADLGMARRLMVVTEQLDFGPEPGGYAQHDWEGLVERRDMLVRRARLALDEAERHPSGANSKDAHSLRCLADGLDDHWGYHVLEPVAEAIAHAVREAAEGEPLPRRQLYRVNDYTSVVAWADRVEAPVGDLARAACEAVARFALR